MQRNIGPVEMTTRCYIRAVKDPVSWQALQCNGNVVQEFRQVTGRIYDVGPLKVMVHFTSGHWNVSYEPLC